MTTVTPSSVPDSSEFGSSASFLVGEYDRNRDTIEGRRTGVVVTGVEGQVFQRRNVGSLAACASGRSRHQLVVAAASLAAAMESGNCGVRVEDAHSGYDEPLRALGDSRPGLVVVMSTGTSAKSKSWPTCRTTNAEVANWG